MALIEWDETMHSALRTPNIEWKKGNHTNDQNWGEKKCGNKTKTQMHSIERVHGKQ